MSSCGHDTPPGSGFCPICGTAQTVERCRCGAVCAPQDHYCHSCGQVLIANSPDSQSTGKTKISLSTLLTLLPPSGNGDLAPAAKVNQSDIEDMFKAFRRQSRKKKPGADDAAD